MSGDEIIARLNVGRRKHRPDLVQGHVKVAKAPDDLRDRNLVRRVATIAGLRVDMRGFEQSSLMIMTQRLDRQVRGAREIADGERGRHVGKFALSPYGRVNHS